MATKKANKGKGKKATTAKKTAPKAEAVATEATAEETPDLMETLKGYAKAVKLRVKKDETEKEFQDRILAAIDKLSDADWGNLPEEVQDWSNALAEQTAKEAGKKAAAKKDPKLEKAKAGAKEKAKAAKKGKKQPEDYIGQEWKEGSNAQILLEVLRTYKKKGATYEELIAKCEGLQAKGKFESTNIKGKVQIVMRAALKRQLVTREDDVWYALEY